MNHFSFSLSPSSLPVPTSICLIVQTITLTHSDAPTCKEGQKLSYGASIGETIAISCDVESSPSPGMFYWLFHSSLQTSSSTASPSATAAASSATSSPVTEVIGSNGTRTASPAHSPASELSSFSAGSPAADKMPAWPAAVLKRSNHFRHPDPVQAVQLVVARLNYSRHPHAQQTTSSLWAQILITGLIIKILEAIA